MLFCFNLDPIVYDPFIWGVVQHHRLIFFLPTGGIDQPLLNPFVDNHLWEKLTANPQTKQFVHQPDFVEIISHLQKNPKDLRHGVSLCKIMQFALYKHV